MKKQQQSCFCVLLLPMPCVFKALPPAPVFLHFYLRALFSNIPRLFRRCQKSKQKNCPRMSSASDAQDVFEVGDEVEEDTTDALVAADAGASRGLPLRAQDEDWEMQVSEGDDGDGFSQGNGLAAALHDEGSAPAAAADATHEAELGLAPPPTATSVPSSVPPPAALACQHCGRGFAKRNGGMLSHIRACAAKLGGIEGAVQNTGLSPPRVHTSADTNDLDAMLA